MISFLLDETGDVVVDSTLQLVEGRDAMVQALRTVLQERQGEWFFNKDEGVDHEVVFAIPLNENRCNIAFVEAASIIEDFREFTSITYKQNSNRQLVVTVEGRMADGSTFEEVLTL